MPPPAPPTDLLDFSVHEWRAIFPTAPPTAAAPFADRLPLAADGKGPGDKHAEPADPITYDEWIAAAAKCGGGWLAFQERGIRTLSPWMSYGLTWVPGVVHALGVVCILPIPFLLDPTGTFGRTQLVAGTVNLATVSALTVIFGAVVHKASRGAPRPCDLHLAFVQQLGRLWQLQVEGMSMLVAHVAGDPFCPCRKCTTPLVRWIPWERLVRSLGQQVPSALFMFLIRWTAVVYLGEYLWPQAWSAFLGAFSLFAILQWSLPSFFLTFSVASDPLVRIGTRVFRRATYLSLSSFLSRAASALTDCSLDSDTLPARELFTVLHRGYALRWSAYGVGPTIAVIIAGPLPMAVVQLVISVSTGSCIPGYVLACILYIPLFVALGVFQLPSLNGQMEAIGELYRGAHLSLVGLLSESAGLPPTPQRDAVRDRLRARAALLQALAGAAEHHTIRFAGLPVTYGLAKTIAVTLLTLVVGCWSILRGFGAYVTLQTYCPAPT